MLCSTTYTEKARRKNKNLVFVVDVHQAVSVVSFNQNVTWVVQESYRVHAIAWAVD